ncbi:MAG: HEAT repeat domain-containing protein [Phycisphaerae bacterium]|nr:HEAT repeat domain-containing protein [Phycisphaerae bacterium]
MIVSLFREFRFFLLIARLKASSIRGRIDAARALGDVSDRRAVDPLIDALDDEFYYVRLAAAEALAKIGDERAVGPLVAKLGRDSNAISEAATRLIARTRSHRGVQPLLELLNKEWDIKEEVCIKKNKGQGIESVFLALKDSDDSLRCSAVRALGEIGDGRAVETLIPLLERTARVPQWIVQRRDGGTACEAIFCHVRQNEDLLIASVAEALGKIGDRRAVEPLIDVFKREDGEDTLCAVRDAAIAALGRLADERALEPLVEEVRKKGSVFKEKIAQALSQMKDGRAVQALIALLDDEMNFVRVAAVEALGRIAGENFGEDKAKWMEWWGRARQG